MAYNRFARTTRDGTIDPATGATYIDIAPVADPDQFDPRGNQIGVSTNRKDFNKPLQAESIQQSTPSTILKYPADDNYLAYILFRVKKINPWDIDAQKARNLLEAPAITGEGGLFDVVDRIVTNATRNEQNAASDRQLIQKAQAAENAKSYVVPVETKATRDKNKDGQDTQDVKDILGVTHRYVEDLPAIKLYMPQAINIMDQVQYNNANIGPSGAAAMGAINSGASLLGGLKTFLGDAVGFLGDALNADPGLSRLAMNRAAQALPTGQSINNTASLGFQVTVNPNTRTLFEGVTIREFSFQFDFYPVSQEESQTVQEIVKFFRTELYPSTIGREGAGVPIGFNFPHVFEIKFRVGEKNAPMPQPHLCYLRNVQSTYNPSSMSFFPDGSPTHTSMTLNFTEFRTLSKADIEEGR